MSQLLSQHEGPGDAELISAVRGGDVSAYADLFERHVGAANRLARQLTNSSDADDLVSEAFAKVLSVLKGGGGPDVAFRAYLLTAVRRLHVDKIRSGQRLHTTDDLTPFDPGVPFRDTAVEGFDNATAAAAFASLPERWQLVLWHTEVEGDKPADIAPLLGMTPNSVSALAYRAREGLRQAFLTSHISDLEDAECRWTHENLGGYVRQGLSKRDTVKVKGHLDECRRCMGIYLELTEVNSGLRGILAPLVLGAAGPAYLATTGVGKASAVLLLGRARDLVMAHSAVAATAAASVVVAAVLVATGVVVNGDRKMSAQTTDTAPTALSTADSASTGGSPQAKKKRSSTTESAPGIAAPSGSGSSAPANTPRSNAPSDTPANPTISAPSTAPTPAAETPEGPSSPATPTTPAAPNTAAPLLSSDLSVDLVAYRDGHIDVVTDGFPNSDTTATMEMTWSPIGVRGSSKSRTVTLSKTSAGSCSLSTGKGSRLSGRCTVRATTPTWTFYYASEGIFEVKVRPNGWEDPNTSNNVNSTKPL